MKLHKIKFLKTGNDKYSMRWGERHHEIKLNANSLRNFLRAISASDVDTLPKSVRHMSYKGMASRIMSGEQPCVWAPDHKLKGLPVSIREDFLKEANENLVKKYAKQTGKSEKEVTKLWDAAKEITSDFFGKKEDDFGDKEWSYVVGVLKKSLGIKENEELAKEFLESEKSAKDFIQSSKEEVQPSDSFGIDSSITQKKKKKKVIDPSKEKEEK